MVEDIEKPETNNIIVQKAMLFDDILIAIRKSSKEDLEAPRTKVLDEIDKLVDVVFEEGAE